MHSIFLFRGTVAKTCTATKGRAPRYKEVLMTSPASDTDIAIALPDYAQVPRSALGPALNDQGYYVGRVERNLYWVTDGSYQSAFLTTKDGVVLFDAPPSIGGNIRRAVDEIASANGVSNKVTHLVYSHHHADHNGASSLFDKNVIRVGHKETKRLLERDNDPARPAPEETFADRRTLKIGGERIELEWRGPNHSPDNIYIHFPDHDTLMLIVSVNPTPFFQKYGDNPWAAVGSLFDAWTEAGAAPVIEKYNGVLAAADVYTRSTVFWVMESIRLDLGFGSYVPP